MPGSNSMNHERQHAEGSSQQNGWPFLSIIVPVRNEGELVCPTLHQILQQDYPRDRFEVIVVDGLSTDDTREKVLTFTQSSAQIKLLDNHRTFASSGRNIGIKAGKGDIFVII